MGILSEIDIKFYMDKYKTNIFVETGTGAGAGLSHALKFGFDRFYSIEILDELYNDNVARFKQPNVTLINDTSISGLKKIFSLVSKDDIIFFWLDAHFPGSGFNLGTLYDEHPRDIKFPLEWELNSIRDNRYGKDVLIIDDLRLLEDGPYSFGNFKDRVMFGFNGSEPFTDILKSTHNFEKSYMREGYLIGTPKEI